MWPFFFLLICPLLATNVRDASVNLHTQPYAVTLKLELGGSATQTITLMRRTLGPGLSVVNSAQQIFSSSVTRGADGFFTAVDTTSLVPGATYIYSGASVGGDFVVGAADRRGELTQAFVVVTAEAAAGAAAAVAGYVDDLTREGFAVQRIDLPSGGGSASALRAQLQSACAASSRPRAIATFIGRVPVVRTGQCCPYDGHSGHHGAVETDQYYMSSGATSQWTDTSVNWVGGSYNDASFHHNTPGDGRFDQDRMPSSANIGVGRVDFYDLQLAGAPSEASLLASYLAKLAAHRRAQPLPGTTSSLVPLAAFYCGFSYTNPVQDTSIRDEFARMCGASNGYGLTTPASTWCASGGAYELLNNGPYALAYFGTGGVDHTAIGQGMSYQAAATSPLRANHAQLYGSYNGNWALPKSLMRSALVSAYTLTSMYGVPFWQMSSDRSAKSYQYMLGGAPVGVGNAAHLNYYRTSITSTKAIFNLMGDPALKLLYTPPVASASASASATVSWSAPPALSASATYSANLIGYHVYRSAAGGATPFTLLNESPTTSTTYSDASASVGSAYRYMVRALYRVHNFDNGVRSFHRDDLALGAVSALVTITSGGGGPTVTPSPTSHPTPQPTPVTPAPTSYPTPNPTPSTPQPMPVTPAPTPNPTPTTPAPSQNPTPPSPAFITELRFVDAATDTVLDVMSLAPPLVNQAPVVQYGSALATASAATQSVRFNINGYETLDSTTPYTLYGDNGQGSIVGSVFSPNTLYVLSATPYTSSDGTGAAGVALTRHFMLSAATPSPTAVSTDAPTDVPTKTPSATPTPEPTSTTPNPTPSTPQPTPSTPQPTPATPAPTPNPTPATPAPTPHPTAFPTDAALPSVERLVLYDALTNTPIAELAAAAAANVFAWSAGNSVTVIAEAPVSTTNSIAFTQTPGGHTNVEGVRPFTLYGDQVVAGTVSGFTAQPDVTYVIEATPYSGVDTAGVEGPSMTRSFTLASAATPHPTPNPTATPYPTPNPTATPAPTPNPTTPAPTPYPTPPVTPSPTPNPTPNPASTSLPTPATPSSSPSPTSLSPSLPPSSMPTSPSTPLDAQCDDCVDTPSQDKAAVALAVSLIAVAACCFIGVVGVGVWLCCRSQRGGARDSAALGSGGRRDTYSSGSSSARASRVQRRSRQPTGSRLSNVFAAHNRVPSTVFADGNAEYRRGRLPSRPTVPIGVNQQRAMPPPGPPRRAQPNWER